MKNASINLDLLRIFDTLSKTHSLTRTADILNVSVASAQRSLDHLRYFFSDRLFLKTATGMAPTPRAMRLLPRIRVALLQIESLETSESFDPASSTQCFSVGALGHGVVSAIAPVLPHFLKEAPSAHLNIQPLGETMVERLSDGRLDLVLYGGNIIPLDCHSCAIANNDYQCLMRRQHPLVRSTPPDERPKMSDFVKYRRIQIEVCAGKEHQKLVAGDTSPPENFEAISTPYFTSSAMLLLDTDLITIMPRSTATRFATLGPWATLPTPWESSHFRLDLLWHHRVHSDPAVIWLRHLIIEHTAHLRY